MSPHDFKDKKVVVMGLGLNQGGLGVAKWLVRQGARVLVTDLKDEHALAPSVAELEKVEGRHRVRYVLGRHRARDFRGADMIIKNPGVPRDSEYVMIARRAGVPIESDMSIFFRLCPYPIVGVTGTKGKTTVTAMAGAMLEEAFGRVFVGGNIRRSALDGGVMEAGGRTPIVLELSSWQLESLVQARLSPSVAVVTNVLPDHLNRYDGMKDYAAAKELILAWQLPTDAAVLSYDNPWTRKMGARVRGERFWASMRPVPDGQNAFFFRGPQAVVRWQGMEIPLFARKDARLPGEHNLFNALLAAGAAWARGAAPQAVARALRKFRGVPHRLERVREVRGATYWNDTAATTPEASVAAMRTISPNRGKKRIVLIAGGADKELAFGEWAKEAARRCKEIILFEGTATPKMLRALRAAGAAVGDVVSSMPDAVRHASLAARRGDHVLLSPACASFGVFVNEFDRGDKFRAAAKKLR